MILEKELKDKEVEYNIVDQPNKSWEVRK